MARRHAIVVAVVGFGLPLAGVASPAEAASTTPTQPQCQTLLTCVVPIVTGVTGGLITSVPTLVHAVPTVVGSVPKTLSTLLGGKPTTPTQGTTTPPPPPNHGKPTVKPQHHKPPTTSATHVTPAPTKAAARITTPTPAKPTVIPQAPTPSTNPVIQVVEQVAHAAEKVVSLFGWNLLALLPMAGIAFGISRRMAASRRSVSGLL
ncbi:hypothetical protein Back2_01140 [Nocardioides baekrokdamisoli]|uniref:Secreted protein n=1 Tax=Nocardioides baekrokdamisoli TaxID=1804624 RepID=A0A3G9IAP3_9ACTN|nr:hypothetical protein [Nocardioides baekrokdamisoli]BBH15827.1 hypothetical protein Back2_01140 [Nocardioides baekrokdamisoli]